MSRQWMKMETLFGGHACLLVQIRLVNMMVTSHACLIVCCTDQVSKHDDYITCLFPCLLVQIRLVMKKA